MQQGESHMASSIFAVGGGKIKKKTPREEMEGEFSVTTENSLYGDDIRYLEITVFGR